MVATETKTLTITPRAAQEIRKLMAARELPETAGLRVGLKGGGCSGFEYVCDMAPKPDKFDEVFELDGGRVFVDMKSLIFMEGFQVDFKRALMGSGFQFENPNATGTCGCGTSFAV